MRQKILTINASGMRAENLYTLLAGVTHTYGSDAEVEHRADGLTVYVDSWRRHK